jgi:hypothetical protein
MSVKGNVPGSAGNSHRAHATNITVLQSFDDARTPAEGLNGKHLKVLAV